MSGPRSSKHSIKGGLEGEKVHSRSAFLEFRGEDGLLDLVDFEQRGHRRIVVNAFLQREGTERYLTKETAPWTSQARKSSAMHDIWCCLM